jgi:glycogen debranching enzyme
MRTVIAGYHWFTDWGRDTMISLEGLTLATGRAIEARWILRTFAHYLRDGLIPNIFREEKIRASATRPMRRCGSFTRYSVMSSIARTRRPWSFFCPS